MIKKRTKISIIVILSVCLGLSAACKETKTIDKPIENNIPPINYEGNMLLNGFDTINDMYKISQLYTWSYSPLGKLSIVNKDNFIPKKTVEDSPQNAIDDVIAKINNLPSVETVTIDNKEEVNSARKAYGSLTDGAKRQITNISKLKALESSEALANKYSLTDLTANSYYTHNLAEGFTGANDWTGFGANLVNSKKGTVIFTFKGMNADIDGAFYMTLFQDGSKDEGQASDGIAVWVRTNVKTLFFQNTTGGSIAFVEGKSIETNKTYTTFYSYEVADDYSKITINIKIVSENDEIIVDGSQDITNISLASFGSKTVEQWLTDSTSDHNTFFISTGNSAKMDVKSLWKIGPSPSDFLDAVEEEVDPHNPSDLAPRQGEGALRVEYKQGPFQEILARFKTSDLPELPVNKIGGFSVQIYNDSASIKKVALSVMKEKNIVLSLDNGEFNLAPYAWTTCNVTFDPIIIDYFQDEIIGVNINFRSKIDSVYYIDDLNISFNKVYTEDIKKAMKNVESIKADIDKLEKITLDSKEILESIYARYDLLPNAYKFTVDNIAILNESISTYFSLLKKTQEASGNYTSIYVEELLGLSQIDSLQGGIFEYTTDEHLEGEQGSLKLTFDESDSWAYLHINPIVASGFDELHIWVKVDTNNATKYAFYPNWKTVNSAFVNGVPTTIASNYVIPNSGEWIELVYKQQFTLSEFNILSLDITTGDQLKASTGSIYIGKVLAISNSSNVVTMIETLANYENGYTAEQKAVVANTRTAYNNLSSVSKLNISNYSKLVEIEAKIWEEGLADLPANVEEITVWNAEYKTIIDNLKLSFNTLDTDVKKKAQTAFDLLEVYETKLMEFRVDYIQSLLNSLILKTDGSYNISELNAIKLATVQFDMLTEDQKLNLNVESVEKLAACRVQIASYYTLNDLLRDSSMKTGNLAQNTLTIPNDWAGYSAMLSNKTKGTIVFTAKGLAANDGALYITLFHDDSKEPNQSGAGVMTYLANASNVIATPSFKNSSYNSNMTINSNTTYTFYVSYVLDDTSVTITIRIEDEVGNVIVNHSFNVSSLTAAGFENSTISNWLKTDSRYTFYINTGATKGLILNSAW